MWLMLKTEIKYQWQTVLFLIVFSIFAIILAMNSRKDFFVHFLPIYLALFSPYALFINAGKEKRNRGMAALPLGVRTLALYRLSLVVFNLIFYGLFFFISYSLLTPNMSTSPAAYIKTGSFILMFYSGIYIGLDFMRGYINRKGITREKAAPVLFLLGIIVQLWLLMAFIKKKSGAHPSFHPGRVIDWIIEHRLFQGEYGHLIALACSLALAFLSIFTYGKSKARF